MKLKGQKFDYNKSIWVQLKRLTVLCDVQNLRTLVSPNEVNKFYQQRWNSLINLACDETGRCSDQLKILTFNLTSKKKKKRLGNFFSSQTKKITFYFSFKVFFNKSDNCSYNLGTIAYS